MQIPISLNLNLLLFLLAELQFGSQYVPIVFSRESIHCRGLIAAPCLSYWGGWGGGGPPNYRDARVKSYGDP